MTDLELLQAKAAAYDGMVRQRDAFRRAYECLEGQVKAKYRALAGVTAADADDFLLVQQVREDLLAAWNEAEALADASGRPKRGHDRWAGKL